MRTIGAGTVALAVLLLLGACNLMNPPAKEYTYPAWGFRASFLTPPTETAKPGTPDGTQPDADLVEAVGGGRDFAVWVADVSKSNLSLDDLASNAADHVSKGIGADIGIQTYAATGDGVMGREYQLTKNGKWVVTLRVFLAGGKFYEVIGKSDLGKDDPALQRFLVTFHTLAAASPQATNAPAPPPPAPPPPP
jgi:hypothetical protein